MTDVLAVDLGGTNFRLARVSAEGEILAQSKLPTRSVSSIAEGIKKLIATVGGEGCSSLVFGAPGVVDLQEGRVVYAPNIPDAFRLEIDRSQLSEALGYEVLLVNDADLATMGEASVGAGAGARSVVYVTCSTGVGAGAVLDGRLVHGRYSAMEIGHTILNMDPVAETEARASGTAMAKRAREANVDLSNAELVAAAAKQELTSLEILSPVASALGAALSNLAWLLGPDVIVVGGGLGLSNPLVLTLARAFFDSCCPPYLTSSVVVPAALGDDAGLRGAPFVAAALSVTAL
ncbi:MAG: ROK family protein [Ferrimicrobium sp.]